MNPVKPASITTSEPSPNQNLPTDPGEEALFEESYASGESMEVVFPADRPEFSLGEEAS